MDQQPKDYSSISPSAKSLLLLKGHTGIPYAKETAALMQGAEVFDLDFGTKDFWFWMRVVHFELRYWSIDQLLRQADNKNILELSSGYSFRGLALCEHDNSLHYIDTDLPEVVATKRDMMTRLHLDQHPNQQFELLPLNALDESAFRSVVQKFGAGPLSIVNEGLLMYLNLDEKVRLCRTIHAVLQQQGGCWITADIYVKRPADMQAELPQREGERRFFEQHHIEENKFDDYDAARAFFAAQGFEVAAEAVPDYQSLTVLPQLLQVLPEEARNRQEQPPKVQATWMLRAV
ncbi:class I SAM-dependent methyltransferase [Hymenobacter negativus]|uniref:Class I SAM-dependent methyltransferase n=1 Tax=Hymenobacter negativus TaxID=2795026 RepID=A0ABS3QN20_9BACT|nr:class I SAM-dependent methyltransferase [Hymenobacter negativus]MBO2012502.1 class I SAM-dependent methyltransferase [Hymenobacter negativus]